MIKSEGNQEHFIQTCASELDNNPCDVGSNVSCESQAYEACHHLNEIHVSKPVELNCPVNSSGNLLLTNIKVEYCQDISGNTADQNLSSRDLCDNPYAENIEQCKENVQERNLHLEEDKNEPCTLNLKNEPESYIMKSPFYEEEGWDVEQVDDQSVMYICKNEEKLVIDCTQNTSTGNLTVNNIRCVDQDEIDVDLKYPLEAVVTSKSTIEENSYILNVYEGTKTYTCDVCSKVFCKKSNLKRHYRSHTGDNPHACDECPARFPTRSRLKEHQNTHTGFKPHCCQLCGKKFARTSNLARHYRTHGGEKQYQCDICDGRFIELTRLREHYLTHTGEKKFICEICGKRFLKKYNLKRHYSTHSGERPYTCETCGRSFSKRLYLLHHRASHVKQKVDTKDVSVSEEDEKDSLILNSEHKTPDDTIKQLEEKSLESCDAVPEHSNEEEEVLHSCHLCTRFFIKERSLHLHLKRHHEEKNGIKCSACNATFSHKSRLKEHFVTHSGERAFPCVICGRQFGRNSNLLRHLQTHTGEKRHQCNKCYKWYSSNTHLKEHYLIHSGVKPHRCDVCAARFRHKSGLQRHYLVHTGEKRLECDICHKKYNRKTRLVTHYQVSHNKVMTTKEDKSLVENQSESRLTNLIQTLEVRLGEPNTVSECNSNSEQQQQIKQSPDQNTVSVSQGNTTLRAEHRLAKLIETLEARLEKPKIIHDSKPFHVLQNVSASDKEELCLSNSTSAVCKTQLENTLSFGPVESSNGVELKSISLSSPIQKCKKSKSVQKEKKRGKDKVISVSSVNSNNANCDTYIKSEPEGGVQ